MKYELLGTMHRMGNVLLCRRKKESFQIARKCKESQLGVKDDEGTVLWAEFLKNSEIPDGYGFSGFHYAGYILDCEEWCLPSWIWTNAAIVKMYCRHGRIEEAKNLTDRLITLQNECGGWVVRNDYDRDGPVPVMAPNDSAYIANNACLELYLLNGGKQYLASAAKCAAWIMETACGDGMVSVGYDMKRKQWRKEYNIVDVGFTAALFARLYECTGEEKYLDFLTAFTNKYIELFFIPGRDGFATSINSKGKRFGGMFGRGQAWALEGLIPASKVLKDPKVKDVVQRCINNLLKVQNAHGGWAYNILRPWMGTDCKAVPVIACSLMNWYSDHPEQKELKRAAERAYVWCLKHTLPEGKGKGGIYSYTFEGAIVHHMYTWTAFAYGSSYAIELIRMIAEG